MTDKKEKDVPPLNTKINEQKGLKETERKKRRSKKIYHLSSQEAIDKSSLINETKCTF